ncbi:TetR/AcrR family transcriptional regulator [Paenibacillus thermotolerans]|uniref:TetR/AcrR family transcriptional regulator n=1 Tax=Paenibacillus thermotolerans TaxID=3027807 RepID=UPI002368E170|nr:MULTISPECIES: TetR/AcrR family transcriptional regulator [unclassified Paenibacillus]
MMDKRTHIIETAIKLFAEKGFHASSIQEIADAAGVAKGSMYFYFRSKDDLLLSIYRYYHELMFAAIEEAGKPFLQSPKQRLAAELGAQMSNVIHFKHFLTMLLKEPFLHNNEEIKQAVMKMKAHALRWLKGRISDIYGMPLEPLIWDCTLIFQSMITSYVGIMLWHTTAFDQKRLPDFLIDRLDEVAAGLMRKAPVPILTARSMEELYKLAADEPAEVNGNPIERIRSIRNRLNDLSLENDLAEELLSSLQVLEDELRRDVPKRVIVNGMLRNLQLAGIPELEESLKQLQQALFQK